MKTYAFLSNKSQLSEKDVRRIPKLAHFLSNKGFTLCTRNEYPAEMLIQEATPNKVILEQGVNYCGYFSDKTLKLGSEICPITLNTPSIEISNKLKNILLLEGRDFFVYLADTPDEHLAVSLSAATFFGIPTYSMSTQETELALFLNSL